MQRKLFCEISPLTYKISTIKNITIRHIRNLFSWFCFARKKASIYFPNLVYQHKSLIRRKLGNVDMQLQENKATNLSIAAKRICCIIIAPGETFSFWELVGNPTANKGYKEGLTIAKGCTSSAIGGGMCQFTNLLHWLVLHSPLTIVEHHHHDGVDLFPDFNRQVPFGVGTSILYNYLDYRFKNNTDTAFQISASIQGEYLCGLLYAENPIPQRYHIKVEGEKFVLEDNIVYRTGNVYRKTVDVRTGNLISKELIRQNHARVTYDTSGLEIENSK